MGLRQEIRFLIKYDRPHPSNGSIREAWPKKNKLPEGAKYFCLLGWPEWKRISPQATVLADLFKDSGMNDFPVEELSFEVGDESTFEPLPAGAYRAELTDCQTSDTKYGESLRFVFVVVEEGKHKGHSSSMFVNKPESKVNPKSNLYKLMMSLGWTPAAGAFKPSDWFGNIYQIVVTPYGDEGRTKITAVIKP